MTVEGAFLTVVGSPAKSREDSGDRAAGTAIYYLLENEIVPTAK